jgi:hypothetical protein
MPSDDCALWRQYQLFFKVFCLVVWLSLQLRIRLKYVSFVVCRFPSFQATPLGAAIKQCDSDMFRVLLDAKADTDHVFTVYLDCDIDFDALQYVQKTMEHEQPDPVRYQRLVEIRALLLQHQVCFLRVHFCVQDFKCLTLFKS